MNPKRPFRCRFRQYLPILALSLAAIMPIARADSPGVGLTGRFEVDFLNFIIDHHFSALRMTELAAGTDATRDTPVPSPADGTSNTPGFTMTRAKAHMEELKSIARRENRMQREEIQTAQGLLKQWYGLTHEPKLTQKGRRQIQLLESVNAGNEFDHLYIETLSRHHYEAITMATDCLVASDLQHSELSRYCGGIQHGQINDINSMRQLLCDRRRICDYQPLRGLKGRHSGSDSEVGADSD